MGRLLLAAVTAALSAAGCSDDDPSGPGGAAGAGGSGGAGGGLLQPTDFLDPASYDCRGPAMPAPGPRPHDLACILDTSCPADLVAAHRMGNPFAPENSLSALRASILLGADIVETDARITLDGRVVLVHDAEVDRTLEGTGNVRDFTLAELKAMAVKLEPGDPPGDFSCERVVTIEEVMAVAEGRIVVELETKDVAAGVAAAEYLRAQGLYGHAYIQCAPSECDAVRAAVPDAPIMVRVESMADLDVADAYDPAPLLVEVDPGPPWTGAEVLGRIHAMPAKAFTNAFLGPDAAALLTGDLSQYPVGYQAGLDVLQTEFPHLALYALGRAQPIGSP